MDTHNIATTPSISTVLVHAAHENLSNRDPTINNGYDLDENEVMIPMAPSLSLSHSNVPQSKYHREVLRYDNTAGENFHLSSPMSTR